MENQKKTLLEHIEEDEKNGILDYPEWGLISFAERHGETDPTDEISKKKFKLLKERFALHQRDEGY